MTQDEYIAEIQRLAAIITRQQQALEEIRHFNRIHNDLEAYLFEVAEYGLGMIEEKPRRENYGIE